MFPFHKSCNWDTDCNNYTTQLNLLNTIYKWKPDLINFEISQPMKELSQLIDLPLPQYGPKVTINQINKQFITILHDLLSYEISIDTAYLRMLLIIDFINIKLNNIPIMMPCYYVSYLKFIINFAILSCITSYHDDQKIHYFNSINININYDGNNYALFEYLCNNFLPNITRQHIKFEYMNKIWKSIISSLPCSFPMEICEMIANYTENKYDEFFDIIHYINHQTIISNSQYLSTWNTYFHSKNNRKTNKIYFSTNEIYINLLNGMKCKKYERGYKTLQEFLEENEREKREQIRLQQMKFDGGNTKRKKKGGRKGRNMAVLRDDGLGKKRRLEENVGDGNTESEGVVDKNQVKKRRRMDGLDGFDENEDVDLLGLGSIVNEDEDVDLVKDNPDVASFMTGC